MKTFRTTGTGSEQTISEIETDKIPLYPTEQDLLDDLANLEVGQIAGTIDPAESELIGVLIQKIQALENKLESDDVYSTDEVKTNKKWIDGKPIYRKCFYSATNWSNNQNIGSIGSYDIIIEVRSTSYNSGASRYYTNYDDSSHTNCASVDNSGNVIVNRLGNYVNSSPAHVIIEYTKPSA